MIRSHYICKRNGSCRRIDYHVDDPSDPPQVRDFHARHPPANHINYQLAEDERVFDQLPTEAELAEAFGES